MKNFEDQPATLAIATAPDWAPDDCRPATVRLIDDEQYLEDLGLRGLASADSAELHQAVRQLKGRLAQAVRLGARRGKLRLVLGALVGLVCGAVAARLADLLQVFA